MGLDIMYRLAQKLTVCPVIIFSDNISIYFPGKLKIIFILKCYIHSPNQFLCISNITTTIYLKDIFLICRKFLFLDKRWSDLF